MQVALAQITVELVAQAINHTGVGLQQHTDAQPIRKDAGNLGPVCGFTGFFFDNTRQNQGLLGCFQRCTRAAHGPGCLGAFVHRSGCAFKHRQVAGAFGVGVGIREKPAFGVNTRPAQLFHDSFWAQPLCIGRKLLCFL